jgi:hypothetical protein
MRQKLSTKEIISRSKNIKDPSHVNWVSLVSDLISAYLETHAESIKAAMTDNAKKAADALAQALTVEIKEYVLEHMPVPKDGKTPTNKELLELMKPLIPKIKDGKTPTNKELLELMKPLIPEVRDGVDADEKAVAKRVLKNMKVKDIKPEEIAKRLNQTKESIDISVIRGFPQLLKELREAIRDKKRKESGGGRVGGGGDIVYTADLSGQTDGIKFTFTVPKHRKAQFVMGSDFPSFLFENNGFTVNAGRTQVTLTTANAPSAGSQLGFQYVV